MKALNLYLLTRNISDGLLQEYEYSLSDRDEPIKIRLDEIQVIRNLIDLFGKDKEALPLYSGWFYSFRIPQIGKEFDLLRICDTCVINIELKSQEVEQEKIVKQLEQNRFYLRHLKKQIISFTVVSENEDNINIYEYNDKCLQSVPVERVIDTIAQHLPLITNDIESLFKPKEFLISPINTPTEFLSGKYFLTNQQAQIKNEILSKIKDPYLFGIQGAAGTGKTLLLYDLAKSIGKLCNVVVIHCGILSQGHTVLDSESNDFSILSAKKISKEALEPFEAVFVDETQRIYPYQLDIIMEAFNTHQLNTCVFSYDFAQTLSRAEITRNIPNRLKENEDFIEYRLTERIRTNKEIASFIRNMLRLYDVPRTKFDYKNIDVIYANNYSESDRILRFYIANGYQFISFTPSRFVKNEIDHYSDATNSHHIIGQEFDNVIVVMDLNFAYDTKGELEGKEHPNPDYLFPRLFYQNITRARNKLCIVVINNKNVFEMLLKIKNGSLQFHEES